MLASIFSKTRPINYVLIGIALVLFYGLSLTRNMAWSADGISIATKGVLLLLLAASLLLVGFISLRNNLTKASSYAVVLFLLFLVLFPTTLGNTKIIVANFFLLLALRRLISLQSLITPKEKIFDASFWILAATVFHFWSILYLVLVFISIVFHVSRDYRNWIIPFIALTAVAVIYIMVGLMLGHDLFDSVIAGMEPGFDFTYFENVYQNIALALFAPIAVLFVIPYSGSISTKPLNLQASHKKVLFSFLAGVAIYVLSNHKNNSFLMFTFAPLAIMGANFIESQENQWVREAIVCSIAAIAIFIFLVQL
ncbi:DUF6427 family protein [Flavobacterium psychrotrophum]|uniref:DUF6427 family protein n=1 Tax=Flavobacterium psychrotrophum TaxID=2294119 RepID=UPI000E30D226|nr:DUF6427 family protein [Flavobacterium psychrotrophum]